MSDNSDILNHICIGDDCLSEIDATGNVFNYQCPDCDELFCIKCSSHTHFPLTCEESSRWDDREFEDNQVSIHLCEQALVTLEQVQNHLDTLDDDLNGVPDSLDNFPNLLDLDTEMHRVVKFFKWLQVLYCFVPRLNDLLRESHILLNARFVELRAVYPRPHSLVWNFAAQRVALATSMIDVLQVLLQTHHHDRVPDSELPIYNIYIPQAINTEIQYWNSILEAPPPRIATERVVGHCLICKEDLNHTCFYCVFNPQICVSMIGGCGHAYHIHCADNYISEAGYCPLSCAWDWETVVFFNTD